LVLVLRFDEVVVVVDDGFLHFVVDNSVIYELFIDLVGFFILDDLLEILIEIWELVENLLERGFVVLEHADIRPGDVVMQDWGLVDNEVMVHHLTSFEVSVRCKVVNHSIHNKTHILGLITGLGDGLSLPKSLSLEFFKVLGVEVVVSILKESVYLDRILVQELCKLSLECRWKNFKQVGHLLIMLDFAFRIEILKVILELIHKHRPNVKLLIQLLDLLHPLLIVGVCF
jgi:hypothetical protein